MSATDSLMMDDHTGSPEEVAAAISETIEKPHTIIEEEPPVEEATSEPFLVAPSYSPPKEVIVSVEDRLKAENLALRIQVATMSKTQVWTEATHAIESWDKQLKDLQDQVKAMQKRFSEVYGIDFNRQHIEPGTGRVIPAPPRQ